MQKGPKKYIQPPFVFSPRIPTNRDKLPGGISLFPFYSSPLLDSRFPPEADKADPTCLLDSRLRGNDTTKTAGWGHPAAQNVGFTGNPTYTDPPFFSPFNRRGEEHWIPHRVRDDTIARKSGFCARLRNPTYLSSPLFLRQVEGDGHARSVFGDDRDCDCLDVSRSLFLSAPDGQEPVAGLQRKIV